MDFAVLVGKKLDVLFLKDASAEKSLNFEVNTLMICKT